MRTPREEAHAAWNNERSGTWCKEGDHFAGCNTTTEMIENARADGAVFGWFARAADDGYGCDARVNDLRSMLARLGISEATWRHKYAEFLR